ncbi:hypothetical protein K493DRAFT_40859 [Basidiobolus meristosporus CBS 931.73]|uniref:Uncharacterized protein n=1 Tax=Basidiobolus meristosporus CBS 931.73 TaxID=1314790 RepID=A0A1Y1Z508_9FUNG|nr:hypothetical protein K493DRAFT_40859 [Basidiobolus meristosporus CBS 931.73]|eukprot:ORY05351.1 hypothetical protein K493DRAFT_40859 [Basidiobolus meristosporus CBS 931.73]
MSLSLVAPRGSPSQPDSVSEALLKIARRHQKRISQVKARLNNDENVLSSCQQILLSLYYTTTYLENNKNLNRVDELPGSVFHWLITVCWGCSASSYSCLSEGSKLAFQDESSWLGLAGSRGLTRGSFYDRTWSKGRNYFEAHYIFRLAFEEIFSTIRKMLKFSTTGAERYKQQLESLADTLVGLAAESEALIQNSGSTR